MHMVLPDDVGRSIAIKLRSGTLRPVSLGEKPFQRAALPRETGAPDKTPIFGEEKDLSSHARYLPSPQYGVIEYGRAALPVAHFILGLACIVNRNSPPARICACVTTLFANGCPFSVTRPT